MPAAITDFFAANLSGITDSLIYIAEAALLLIGVFKCLVPLITTRRALRRAIRLLQQDAGSRQGTPVWQEKRFMGSRLKGSWLRFLQNAEQLDRRGLPCNVEDYINDDTVTHGPGNAQLADLIPGLLTSLGILGTFMGMMDGLGGLDFSNSDKIIEGIPVLLNGMQFAFGTSVAGVSMSIIFNVVNRILQGSSYRAIDDFVECFTTLAMQRPLDNDVQLICQNQDSNHMLSNLTEVVPAQLAGAMEVSVSRAMQPVAKAMDSFLVGATRAQVDGVGRIVSNFVQQMNMSLNDQFVQLGRTMADFNQNQQVSLEQLSRAVQASQIIVEDVGQLHAVSQDVLTRFEQYVSELSVARQRDEHFEQSSAELLGRMQQMNEQQSAAYNQVRAAQESLTRTVAQFTDTGVSAIAGMQKATSMQGEQMGKAADAMHTAGRELSDGCQKFVESSVASLSETLGRFEQQMNALVDALGKKMDTLTASGVSGDTAQQTAELQRLLSRLSACVPAKEE